MENTTASMPSSVDIAGIMQASLDYVEGWFNADAERMRRCLHPDLVKRTIMHDLQQSIWSLRRPLDAQMMVDLTQAGGGSDAPAAEKTYEVKILDVFRHIATVKVTSHPYMDYLHLARLNDRWLIVNVLWELQQGEMGPDS
jgi:hypothetical protein